MAPDSGHGEHGDEWYKSDGSHGARRDKIDGKGDDQRPSDRPGAAARPAESESVVRDPRDEETQLWEAFRLYGDQRARSSLIERHARLVGLVRCGDFAHVVAQDGPDLAKRVRLVGAGRRDR
jgi:hypothetical protein